MKFENTYSGLGEQFFKRVLPQKAIEPKLLLWNTELANSLLIDDNLQNNHHLLSQYFSGNELPDGAESIALAYSGHQFGHFNPQLGDGRAHLLGEILDEKNVRCDIQLKGSGQTPFSRRGDGKCALAPALREYIMSEAMFALGVPTSRCLAVVSTGETIHRGLAKAGAVVTRVAKSHIRVGTFQYFAARGDTASLKTLLDYSIERHIPEIKSREINNLESQGTDLAEEQRILLFLERTIDKQITLVVEWLRVGFIHGVMNTDNTAISGETIDFGPCAMMGSYNEKAVFSSIDEYGRYAFGSQGKIAQWNMARLADCLLPLVAECQNVSCDEHLSLDDKKEAQLQLALEKVEKIIHQFPSKFETAYYAMYANKLGMSQIDTPDKALIEGVLEIMQTKRLDYTQTFCRLTQSLTDIVIADELKAELGDWYTRWLSVIEKTNYSDQDNNIEAALAIMSKNNPIVIPRNHHVEQILSRCEDALANSPTQLSANGSINSIVAEFITVLCSPYSQLDATKNYQDTPADGDRYYQTFCGT